MIPRAEKFRRLLSEENLEALCAARSSDGRRAILGGMVDRLCDRALAFEASAGQREEITVRAERLMSAMLAGHDDAHADAWSEDWRVRASAAARRLEANAWLDPSVVGSLSRKTGASWERAAVMDGRAAAEALFIAARETIAPGFKEALERLHETETVSLEHEASGMERWDAAFACLASEFARNAAATGRDRASAEAASMVAGRLLRGKALMKKENLQSNALLVQQMGIAARTVRHTGLSYRGGKRGGERPERLRLDRLVETVRAIGETREAVWPDDLGLSPALGSAAVSAAFGRGLRREASAPIGWQMEAVDDESVALRYPPVVIRLPRRIWQEVGRLSLESAARRFDEIASDPRTEEAEAQKTGLLADVLCADAEKLAAPNISFAAYTGMSYGGPAAIGRAADGAALYWSVPGGRFPWRLICRGKNGRRLRCRAVADVDGTFVGYLAHDPLSGELHGKPLRAFYDAEGRRIGFAAADEELKLRLGEPAQGFATAPEWIPI